MLIKINIIIMILIPLCVLLRIKALKSSGKLNKNKKNQTLYEKLYASIANVVLVSIPILNIGILLTCLLMNDDKFISIVLGKEEEVWNE